MRQETTSRSDGDRFLINYWYAHPVGHAIEGLRYCLGYHMADPSRRISLILHQKTAIELAGLCPFIEACYGVDYSPWWGDAEPAPSLSAIPREWDFVVDNHRRVEANQQQLLGGYFDACDAHFTAAEGRALTGRQPPSYLRNQALRLELPGGSRERAAVHLKDADLGIAVMPAGSGPAERYPSVGSWELLLKQLRLRYPDAVIFLTGRLAQGGGTSTTLTRSQADLLLGACPGLVDFFDRGLLEQLALIERCRLFISPHTGFGTAVVAVGTSWLTIAGGPWHEYLFNGVPCFSVLPDPQRYPCYALEGADRVVEDTSGKRLISMCDARIRDDLEAILAAATDLIDENISYDEALRGHFNRLVAFYGGRRDLIWSFDNVHDSVIGVDGVFDDPQLG